MRILIINNLYPPQSLGGYERAMADFARLLKSRGHDVLVLAGNAEYLHAPYDSSLSDPPLQRSLKLHGEWSSQGVKRFDETTVASFEEHNIALLNRILKSFKPEVCLTGNIDFIQTGASILHQCLSSGIATIHYVMNAVPGYAWEDAPQSPMFRYITCSDWLRYHLAVTKYPMLSAQTIYPGASTEEFYNQELPKHDRLRIAYASLVAPYKGIDVLIEALYLLKSYDIDFLATIAGGTFLPEYVNDLSEFIEAEKLSDKIKLVGALSRKNLVKLYREHNVLVFPSRFDEPFGISQVEAMSSGVTLITSGTGGAREIIEAHGNDGLFFDTEDPIDLANQIAFLTKNPEDWIKISKNGQTRATSYFSQTDAAEQLEKQILDLVKQ